MTYTFVRRDAAGEALLCLLNLSDKPVDLELALPDIASACTLIDTDRQRYGGQTPDASQEVQPCQKGQLTVSLPACTGQLLKLKTVAN